MWYQKTLSEIEDTLKTNAHSGLTSSEVLLRQKKLGINELPKGRRHSWYTFLAQQFKNPLVYILGFGVVVTFALSEWIDMAVIILALLINVLVGFWQEFKSNNILKKLKEVVYVKALVLRDGTLHEIPSKGLVPGDIVQLKPGLKVPADIRIIESHNLSINQATLTGESVPDRKNSEVITETLPLADIENMAYMGTIVQQGFGKGVVVKIGAETEIGKIAALTERTESAKTPLQERIGQLGKGIAIVVGIFAVLILLIGNFNPSFELKELLITSIAVTVAGVPEGLPAAISIILAVSAQRILRRKGIIKNLLAAETLGSASVIVTDKTGTLTAGRMEVVDIATKDSKNKLHINRNLALANEASLETTDTGDIRPIGEPTDVAKLRHALDHNIKVPQLMEQFPQVGFLGFKAENMFIAALHKEERDGVLYVNGSPEKILSLSTKEGGHSLSSSHREELLSRAATFSEDGLRVIGVAMKRLPLSKEGELTEDEVEKEVRDLEFLGLVSIKDPIRPDVQDSIATANGAGIRTIIATGDHKLTAASVASELDIPNAENVIEGVEIEKLSDEELLSVVQNVNVYARMTPEHKIRVIKALRSQKEVVAMTGDGINDAPALNGADIGVAVGSGTDIAKEAADLVLIDNSFTTIVKAVKEGRIAFDNIRKVTVLLLTSSFSEVILVMSSLLIPLFTSYPLLPLPVTALQILYMNLVEDTFPNIAMAFEPGERDVMKRPPLPKNVPILDKEARLIIFAVGIITDILLVGVFLSLFSAGLPILLIQTVIFAAIGIDSLFYIFSIKSLREPIWKHNPFNNPYLVVAVIFAALTVIAGIYVPFMNNILGTVPLEGSYLVLVIALALVKLALIEVVKYLFGTHKEPHPTQPVALATS